MKQLEEISIEQLQREIDWFKDVTEYPVVPDPQVREEQIRWRAERLAQRVLLEKVKLGKIKVTEELMKSVTNPSWKQELNEAICLSKVR